MKNKYIGTGIRGLWLAFIVGLLAMQNAKGANPTATLTSPGNSTVAVGTTVTVTGVATDADGTMNEHWLEVKRPAGDWSWEGWLVQEPFGSLINGSAYSSTKSTTFTLSTLGDYVFRTTAHDPTNDSWAISTEYTVHVVSGSTSPTVTLTSPSANYALVGSSVTVTGTAIDNGTMNQHWLEVKRPAGDWSWEGWLTSEPWGPNLNGSASSSTKSTSFTLSSSGNYVFRSTAYDPVPAAWTISNEQTVQVKNAPIFAVSVSSAYIRQSTYTVTSLNNSLTSFTTYIEASGGGQYLSYSGTGSSGSKTVTYTAETPVFPPLPYTIVMTATDSFGTHTKRVLITSLSSAFNWQGFP